MADEEAVAVERDDPIADVHAAIEQLNKPENDEPKGDRVRNEKGQFVKADEAPADAEAALEPAEELPATEDNSKAIDEANQILSSPPKEWSAGAKALFAKLPATLQREFLAERQSREKEVSDGFAQKSKELDQWKQIDGILNPRRSYYQRFGFKSDAEAVNHLLTLSDSMERDPGGTLARLAQHYGVQWQQIGTAQQPQFQQQAQLPDLDRLIEEKMGMASAKAEVADFEADTAAHPHLTEVRPMMAMLLQGGQAKDLQSAYDMAVWATPHLREQEIARKQQEVARQKPAQAQHAAKAKTAVKASLTGSPNGSPKPQAVKKPSGSFDDILQDVRAAMEQVAN